jgi:hypothetical protein
VYLHEGKPNYINLSKASQSPTGKQNGDEKPLPNKLTPSIRLVRYRLDVGFQHKVSLDEIKKVLVEESGVDVNNIANVRIQDCYTLIDSSPENGRNQPAEAGYKARKTAQQKTWQSNTSTHPLRQFTAHQRSG